MQKLPFSIQTLAWFALLVAVAVAVHWRAVRPALDEPMGYDYLLEPNPKSVANFADAGWQIAGSQATPTDAPVTFPLPPGNWFTATAWVGGSGEQEWVLRFSTPGARTTVFLPAGKELQVPIAEINDPRTSMTLTLSPRGEIKRGEYINKLRVRLRADLPDHSLSLPGIVALGMLPAMLTLLLLRNKKRSLNGAITSASAFGVAVVLLSLWFPEISQAAIGVGLVFLALIGAALWKRPDAPELRRLAELCFVAAIVLVALQVRWSEFMDLRHVELRPDAVGYIEIAREGSFYQTAQDHAPWVREPLFPAALRAWMLFAPENAASARFFGLLLGLLTPVLTWLAGRRLFSPFSGLLAAAVLAANPFWAETSVSVLRLDLIACSLLALVCVPLYLSERSWWRAGGFAAFGSALALLRINNLLLLPVFVAWEAWRSKWKPGEIAAALVLPVLVVIPHLWFNYHYNDSGDAMLSSNVHVRYYLNRDMIGEPGFPATYQDWIGDEYAGGVVNSLEMFTYYSPGEVVRRFNVGYVNIFAYRFPHGTLFGGYELLMLPGLLGVWVLARRRESWWVVGWYVAYAFPVAFIAARDIDYRLAAPVAPLILWIWAAGIEELGKQIIGLAHRRSAPE